MTARVLDRMKCGDARTLDRIHVLKEQQARTIVTSPPYLDTHNYGGVDQIGYGQPRKRYFSDLTQIFEHCLDLSTDDSTMWLVVGAVRRNGRLIQLPEILTSLAEKAGWIPREQITWAKEKSLPWTKLGEFRDVTEQVILLSKSDTFMFELNDLLSPTPNSPWWRKYPERYSPQGRKPTNLWNIQIPTQGSWKNGPGHLCPFPHELTFRMISLTSEQGDVVLDPFAGVGSVPAMAEAMGRIGFGLELSQQYVDRFPETLRQSQEWFSQKERDIENSRLKHKIFYDTIVELRLLKFGNIVGSYLVTEGYPVEWIHVTRMLLQADEKFKIVVGHFEVKVPELLQESAIIESLEKISNKPPLSKFGVQPVFHFTDRERPSPPRYWYEGGKYLLAPTLTKPETRYLHLSSDFKPRVEEISELRDDTSRTDDSDNLSSAIQMEQRQPALFDIRSY